MWEHQSTLISFNLHSILEEKNQSCICACIMTCKKTVLRVTTKTDATWRLDKSIHQSIESKFCSHLDEIAFAEIFVCWCWSTRFPACTGLSLAATNKFSLNAHNNTFISIDQLPYSNVALKISLFTWGAEGRQSPMAGEMVLAGTAPQVKLLWNTLLILHTNPAASYIVSCSVLRMRLSILEFPIQNHFISTIVDIFHS